MRLVHLLLLLVVWNLIPSVRADENLVQVINHGVAAFEKRFEMIDRAEKSVDVEYFIYNKDEAGRLFSQALVKKKEQNPSIQIRVIVDASSTVLKLDAYDVAAFKAHGIEVRYYNKISLVHFDKAQFRDHRKLIVIDGKEAITGSRNIADEYFDMSETFNFRDRDIWVEGPIVAQMQQSFEDYWEHEITTSVAPPALNTPKKKYKAELAAKLFEETAEDKIMRAAIRNVGAPILGDTHSYGHCDSLSYVTDVPGYQRAYTRRVLPKLLGRLNEMKTGEMLYVESPYFIIHDQKAKDAMAFLKEKNIQGVLLTNSLASTDAFYVAANFYPKVSFYESIAKAQMYVFQGNLPENTPFIKYTNGHPLAEKAVWGIHSKTLVFGDDAFTIGTFNLDPRSANLNSEMMMFCDGSPGLAQYVTDDIKSRIAASDLVDKDGNLPNGKTIFDRVDNWKKFKFKMSIPISEWFSYLL